MLIAINNECSPREEEKSAFIGVINMLDFWSDERDRNQNYIDCDELYRWYWDSYYDQSPGVQERTAVTTQFANLPRKQKDKECKPFTGLQYLQIDIANQMANTDDPHVVSDKSQLEDRIAWVQQYENDLEDLVDLADKPFQYLAASHGVS